MKYYLIEIGCMNSWRNHWKEVVSLHLETVAIISNTGYDYHKKYYRDTSEKYIMYCLLSPNLTVLYSTFYTVLYSTFYTVLYSTFYTALYSTV